MSRTSFYLGLVGALALSMASPAVASTPVGSVTSVAAGPTHVGPGESIQTAVDSAEPGATILVTGRHRENVVVQTDGLTLLGDGAVLLPPSVPAAHACYDPTVIDEAVHGICVWGDIDLETGEVARYVMGVTVRGFRIRGFAGTGLVAVAAMNTTFVGNRLRDNVDSGINTSNSLRTRIWENRSSGNEFGVFSSSAEGTSIVANTIRGNCVGVALLAAADSRIRANHIVRNRRACPAADDFPALSGVGVALLGSRDTSVVANRIMRNRATGVSVVRGGIVVAEESSGSLVGRNVVLGNDPDLSWDETPTGNVFSHNVCYTSIPENLCTQENEQRVVDFLDHALLGLPQDGA